MEDVDQAIQGMQEKIPPEILGFVIAAGIVLALIAVVAVIIAFQRRGLAESGAMPGTGGRVTPKEQARTRDAAWAEGFMADDVERDVPDMQEDRQGAMIRRRCARYVYPEHLESDAEWALLRRPGAPGTGLIPAGWELQWRKGAPDARIESVLAAIAADSRWDGRFFEMEAARNTLTYYWDEFGGKPQVELLKSYHARLKNKDVP